MKKTALYSWIFVAFLILIVIIGSLSEDNNIDESLPDKEYFTQLLTNKIEKLSSNTVFKKLQYEDGYPYMTIEYEYSQCVSSCKNEINKQVAKIYAELSNVKDRLKATKISTSIDIWVYTNFVDENNNKKSSVAARYSVPIENFYDINFNNHDNMEKYSKFFHKALD